jgi:uncharacterized protein (DUF2267 family)
MTTGLDVFDSTIEKTNKLLKDIESEMGWQNRRNQTYLALRSVLHALRDRLPIEEAVHFSAQLPILVKGIYFDGWNPLIVPVKMSKAEFLSYIGNQFKFDVKDGIESMTKKVLIRIFEMIDPGEANKILASLPNDITSIFC